MLKPIEHITEKINKKVRSEYNEVYTKDVKKNYFTIEERQRLEEIKKRNLVHAIYEYNVAKKQMEKKTKYSRGHLLFQIIPNEQEQYKINYYISSYFCDRVEPILEGNIFLSKNELEAFYYYHSKKYGTTISMERETLSDTKTFLCMKSEQEYEFCAIGKIDLTEIQSLNIMVKSEQWKEKYKKLELSISKSR